MASESGEGSYGCGKKVVKPTKNAVKLLTRGIKWIWKNHSSIKQHSVEEIGYSVDIGDLLFTPERDFLVKYDGELVRVGDLDGKTIVLCLIPLSDNYLYMSPGTDYLDMVDAYNELMQNKDYVEFVFVPICSDRYTAETFGSQEGLYEHLLSTTPFLAIPFSDAAVCGERVMMTFSDMAGRMEMPYWVMIDPTNSVVANRYLYYSVFKLYGRAELYPLSLERIKFLEQSQYRKDLINMWAELLASGDRDFLHSSDGNNVLISSLQGKVIGLYFCENIPHPPRVELIKNVYEEVKSCGYDFEIVHITFHYHCVNAKHHTTDPSVELRPKSMGWLTLPFKDPSCRKLQRILNCHEENSWDGDILVILDLRQADIGFEYAGAEIFEACGAKAYPFTRQSLFEAEYKNMPI